MSGGPDPFGTAAVRERVLAAWTASPARLREDANAEEDFSLGGYRDRLVVELAQNAADAAAVAGVPGRVRFSLSLNGMVLAVANTGAPLDPAGVDALATLRASAKRGGGSVGRFGVGFAAVLAVTDEPVVLSRSGAVRFSRADSAQLVAEIPELTDEVRRRDGHVPVLRLPFEAEGEPPQGFASVVLLPMRDDAAADLTRRSLQAVDDALLLALPGLAEVEIELDGTTRVLRDAAARWVSVGRAGTFADAERAELYAGRPVEEAQRPWWSAQWALPRSPETRVPQVVHAPTPTDEPLTWPALLIASFPLEPSRRHVAPGPLTDRIVNEAATTYAELLTERSAEGMDMLDLVPVGLGAGALDSALRVATLERLRVSPVLRAAEDGSPVRPRDAVTVDGLDPAALGALAPYVAGLVDASPGARAALRWLGVPELGLAEVVEALPYAENPAGWRERYAALSSLAETPEGREALGLLPVPLADGRVVRSARGLLLPPPGLDAELLEDLARAGVRIVHPDAAHALLTRLGAIAAAAVDVLPDPAVRELVETSPEAEDPEAVADTVLGLLRAAVGEGGPDLAAGSLAWLGDLALPDVDGELAPASALALPGSPAAGFLDPDEIGVVSSELVERWGADVLAACGVLSGLAVVSADEVDLTDPPKWLADLDGFGEWSAAVVRAAGLDGPVVAGELLVVRDLDVVRPDRWAAAVGALSASPRTRAAVVDPVRLRDLAGRGHDAPSYTSWWLSRELSLDARHDPDADPVVRALLDPAPDWVAGLDDGVRRALGVVRGVTDLPGSAATLLLERVAEPGREVAVSGLLAVWSWLSGLASGGGGGPGRDVKPPDRVRAWNGDAPVIVDAAEVSIVDEPKWLQRNDIGPFIVAPAGSADALADLLDVDLAIERADGVVTSEGVAVPVPVVAREVLPGSAEEWHRHERLEVDGVPVEWWVDDTGRAHAADASGLARALAWSSGRWGVRQALAAVLAEPQRAPEVVLDVAFET
ncbi:MAG: sacsin N-terminal ATP-binding-like domain-containing protein [Actinomycetales bacterium]